jgi:hypothetical protein
MANLRITGFSGLGGGRNDDVQAVAGPPTEEQIVAIGGASAPSAAFAANTTIVRLHAEAICAVYVGGQNPTATAGQSARMLAGQTEYFRVVAGDKLAVIADT